MALTPVMSLSDPSRQTHAPRFENSFSDDHPYSDREQLFDASDLAAPMSHV